MFWNAVIVYLFTEVLLCQAQSDIVCQGHHFQASCFTGQVLVFHSAIYGRTDGRACPSSPSATANTNCVQPGTVSLLNQMCFGKEECLFEVDDATFGNPCPGTEKYLEVEFKCVPGEEITEICTKYKLNLNNKPSGYIKSPNYPAAYEPDKDCVAILKPRNGFRYDITLLDLDMEDRNGMMGCFDWLIVKDNTNAAKTFNYCGTTDKIHTSKPRKVQQLKEVMVSFTSDLVTQRNGFLLRFEEVFEDRLADNQEL